MAAAPKTAAAVPPPLSPPPHVPVSGITPALKAKAPELTETPKGLDPVKAFNERSRAAIAKATGEGLRAQDAAAGEDAATSPKPSTGSRTTTAASTAAKTSASPDPVGKAAGEPTTSKKAAAGSDAGTTEKPQADAKAAGSTSANSEAPAPDPYQFGVFKKWAEQNPEAAAELGEKLFWQGKMPPDTKKEWIGLQNKKRKVTESIRSAHEQSMSEARAERQAAEEARQAMDGAATKLSPIADLWEAVAEGVAADPANPRIDFDAADAAFMENAKISIDDYMRLRARRSIASTPDAVRLRVENAKLKRELSAKADSKSAGAPTVKETAGTDAPAAVTKGKADRDWSTEIDGKHKIRQLDGWNDMLDAEMRKYRDSDTDEYSADPDEMADKLLKREIARMMEEESEPEPVPRKRPPKVEAKPARTAPGVPPASELRPKRAPTLAAADDDEEDRVKIAGLTFAQRQKRALERHEMRRRGEIE